MPKDRVSSVNKSSNQVKFTATRVSMSRADLNKTRAATGSINKKIITKNPLRAIPVKAVLACTKPVSAQTSKATQVNTKKRKASEAFEAPAPTYNEVTASLKSQAAWDLRGHLSDLRAMVKLNTTRLNDALESKATVKDLKKQQAIQTSESAEKAEKLRFLIKEIQKKHTVDIQEMHIKQKAKYRKSNDEYLSHKNGASEMKLKIAAAKEKSRNEKSKLTDIQLKNEIIKSSVEVMSIEITSVKDKTNKTDEDIKVLKVSIAANKAEIEKELLQQLNTKKAENLKIQEKIKDLEDKKQKSLEKKI